MTGVNEIRAKFLEFFERNGHTIVPSSPLVPRNDPTLMFANSGMVQFKNVFVGAETRDYVRATTAQKCVRAGGKHNDLDNVGYTARHHTFFEMLGNFSFGDYFKERAIELAWTLITKDYGLDAKRLLVTVYSEDDQAHALWKKIAGLPDSRIIRIPTSDNFWRMGDTGPCGPCSEIFFDHGDKIAGGPPGSTDQDGDRFIEIWNLVFMQYEERGPKSDGTTDRVDLPKPSIDTGMGLERVAAVLQGEHDNYEIDLFKALIAASVDLLGVPAEGSARASHRVIADHLRASSFLIADGVLPSNEGRGYVVRRIMRRAMRHLQLLGAKEPSMYRLVPVLTREMGQAYPELIRAQSMITETLQLEETRFRKTLERGLGLLDEASGKLTKGATLAGDVAFKLYDTYGFPLDLTQDALRAREISVDTDGFATAMAAQKAEARKAWKGTGEAATEAVWFDLKDKHGATEFLGYDTEIAEGEVRALVKDGKPVTSLQSGDEAALVLNQTPFYAESGGQVGDQGMIRTVGGRFAVSDTVKRLGDLWVHLGTVTSGTIKAGEAAELTVDHSRRTATRANHSATHLLHEALRQVLGEHVAQKGSLVDPARLRFDFSHTKPVSPAELAAVETMANALVLQNDEVTTRLMDLDAARATGAMALFGEKYGDEVRVVAMGQKVRSQIPSSSKGSDSSSAGPVRAWSVELCGGTHVRRTGDIGLVRVLSDSGVAAGVRRLEALTGEGARRHLAEQDERVRAVAAALKVAPAEIVPRVEALMEELKRLERELSDARKQLALGGGVAPGSGEAAASGMAEINGIRFLGRIVKGVEAKDLKSLADQAKTQLGSGVAVFIAVSDDGKGAIVAGVTDDLAKRISAVDLVKAGAAAMGGKGGGGRADMAQAGGPDGANAEVALAAARALLG